MKTSSISLFLLMFFACQTHSSALRVLRAGEKRFEDVPPTLAHETWKQPEIANGEPMILVRLMEGQNDVRITSHGRMEIELVEENTTYVTTTEGVTILLKKKEGVPARIQKWIQLAETAQDNLVELHSVQTLWEARGFSTRTVPLGFRYEISGKPIDNRRNLLLWTNEFKNETDMRQAQNDIFNRFGLSVITYDELLTSSQVQLLLQDSSGATYNTTRGPVSIRALDNFRLEVKSVEYGVGYPFHGFEDRTFRGEIRVVPDRRGALAVVNRVPLEELLEGLVPAEIFPQAHLEALKAQAVTARGEVLAKLGVKHVGDPYHLCSEQHCAVYKGTRAETPATHVAVAATHGEVLLSQNGKLVDSVYSAMCGGHTENNENVWGGQPDANLRGKPDVLHDGDIPSTSNVEAFLVQESPSACRLASFSQPNRYRWERAFSDFQVQEMTSNLGVGRLKDLSVIERGISGRTRTLKVTGENGVTYIHGGLNIRKTFALLPSALFVVSRSQGPESEIALWIFKGGGHGHGVGMCQTGAIGRAESGQNYREILNHYYSGAQITPFYSR